MNITVFGACCESLSLSFKRKKNINPKIRDMVHELEEIIRSQTQRDAIPNFAPIIFGIRQITEAQICFIGSFHDGRLDILNNTHMWENASLAFFRQFGLTDCIHHPKTPWLEELLQGRIIFNKRPVKVPDGHPPINNFFLLPIIVFGRTIGAIGCINMKKMNKKIPSILETSNALLGPLILYKAKPLKSRQDRIKEESRPRIRSNPICKEFM